MIITMPKLGLTMTEATLTKWLKPAGSPVKPGEAIFEFESDKSVLEFESPAAGILTQHLIQPGQTVPCGTPVAHLETMNNEQLAINNEQLAINNEPSSPSPTLQPSNPPTLHPSIPPSLHPSIPPPSTLPAFQPSIPPATPAAKRRARELGLDLSQVTGRGPAGRIQWIDVEEAGRQEQAQISTVHATPVAKRAAADLAVDLSQLSGSGSGGRVVKADVLQAAAPIVPTPAELPTGLTTQPLTGLRRVIAQRMSQSAFTAPHVTLFTEADATDLVTARAQLNAELAAASIKISYNALFVAIVARLLAEQPYLNACLVDDTIHLYQEINLALAVDTERGLIAPVIRRADQLNLVEIQQQAEALIERALSGQITPDDTTGGTFTLTNLGSFEIDGFTPIINQPQAAILGLGRIVAKPVVFQNEIKVRQMLALSLSFDHRLIDGGPAARFLQRVKQLVERPFVLMLPIKL